MDRAIKELFAFRGNRLVSRCTGHWPSVKSTLNILDPLPHFFSAHRLPKEKEFGSDHFADAPRVLLAVGDPGMWNPAV